MKNVLSLLVLLIVSIGFTACTADGLVDADTLKGIANSIRESLPSKAEFKDMAEKHIATLPADEQVQARKDLAEALASWPTNEEIDLKLDEAIDEFAASAPSRDEVEKALRDAADELPSNSQLHELIDQLPDNDELKNVVDESVADFEESLDSVARKLKEEGQ